MELVDTLDSKSCERKLVTVQVRPAAPQESNQMVFRYDTDFVDFPGPDFSSAQNAQLSDVKEVKKPIDRSVWEAIHVDGYVPNDRCIDETELLRLQGSPNPDAQRVLGAAIRLGLALPDIEPPL